MFRENTNDEILEFYKQNTIDIRESEDMSIYGFILSRQHIIKEIKRRDIPIPDPVVPKQNLKKDFIELSRKIQKQVVYNKICDSELIYDYLILKKQLEEQNIPIPTEKEIYL